jgi:hypothetical protein
MFTPTLLTEKESADFLSIKPDTLRRWRWLGKGPAHHKIGASVRYHRDDLDKFITSRRVDREAE